MRVQDYSRTIPAGQETTISQPGQHVTLAVCSPDLAVRVLIDGPGGANVYLKQGQKFPADAQFEQITIKNENGVAVDVTVIIGGHGFEDNRLSGSVSISGGSLAKGATLVISSATAGVASSTVLAPAATRRKVVIKNTHATDTAYWCEDPTAATMGKYPIGPGEEQAIESTDGINAIRGGANDITLLFREERD